ncbi:helix-turn-helix transcriptional regulator [Faecalicatena orotica]|uniref:helix-turn-helix transcriptional regulator n=1 Tax=Faecalicatena orotica TaxID=1544 RepID=UPI0032170409
MTKNTIGHNIRTLRKEHNMTQEQLAQQLSMKRQTLSNYEIGKRIPDIYELITIADIFDVTLDEIAGRKKSGKGCTKKADPPLTGSQPD